MKSFSTFAIALFLIFSWTEADGRRLPYTREKLKNAGTLIVGGRPAKQGEAPYQLSIQAFESHWCGASLVEIDGLQFGVTAAHCVEEGDSVDLVAGDINFADNTGIEQKLHVSSIVAHQNWSWITLENDIALLFLNGSYLLNDNISTIALPVHGQETSQGNVTVSGWGDLEYMGSSPDELQIVKIPVVNDTACQQAYADWDYHPTNEMMCTGTPSGHPSPCNGDSGGPAVTDSGYLAGIVSWTYYGCGNDGYPAVYTEVAHYMDWIHDKVASYKNSV